MSKIEKNEALKLTALVFWIIVHKPDGVRLSRILLSAKALAFFAIVGVWNHQCSSLNIAPE